MDEPGEHLCVQNDGWMVDGEMTACHDMALYGSCGSEVCSGQDEYIGMCECDCHDEPEVPADDR